MKPAAALVSSIAGAAFAPGALAFRAAPAEGGRILQPRMI